MAKYTASVVGAGMGGRLSLNALAASPRFELQAACDLKPEVCAQLQRDFPAIRTYTSHTRMFAECPTEVVCVSTFAPSHLPVTLDALELPLKGILVEKPLGDLWQSGSQLLGAVRAAGIPMAVPHNLLASNHSLQIIELVRHGAIGDLELVHVECAQWDLINAGIHWINFFVNLTGLEAVDSVLCQCDDSTRTWRDGLQVETLAVTSVQTRTGVRMMMTTGDSVPNTDGGDIVWHVYGSAGAIKFWGWKPEYEIRNAENPAGRLVQVEPTAPTGHQRHLEGMADQIEGAPLDYSVAESSLMALEICEAAYASNRHGCQVTMPLADFAFPTPNDWDPGKPYSGTGGGRDGRNL